MKKRMKLTEKELAIGMWLYIKLMIQQNNSYEIAYIPNLKRDYLSAHDTHVSWINDCIFCDIYDSCIVCPLHTCNPIKWFLYQQACGFTLSPRDNHYEAITTDHKFYRKTRLSACNKIMELIEKYVPDDYDHVKYVVNNAWGTKNEKEDKTN